MFETDGTGRTPSSLERFLFLLLFIYIIYFHFYSILFLNFGRHTLERVYELQVENNVGTILNLCSQHAKCRAVE